MMRPLIGSRAVADYEIPTTVRGALRIFAWTSAPFIFFLLAGERFLDGHYLQAAFCFVAFVASVFLVVRWEGLGLLWKTFLKWRRQLITWALIIVGAVLLGLGIVRLALDKEPPQDLSQELAAERSARVSLDNQLAATRRELNNFRNSQSGSGGKYGPSFDEDNFKASSDSASERERIAPRDIQRILGALDEIETVADKDIWPTINSASSWAVNWRGVVRNQSNGGIQLYTQIRDDLKVKVWEQIDAILAKYPKYDSTLQEALALDYPPATNDLSKALQGCIDAIGRLPHNFPPSMDDLLEPQFKELIKQANLASDWEMEAKRRLIAIKKNLKDNGTAEFKSR